MVMFLSVLSITYRWFSVGISFSVGLGLIPAENPRDCSKPKPHGSVYEKSKRQIKKKASTTERQTKRRENSNIANKLNLL
jgi:hypothetical protein